MFVQVFVTVVIAHVFLSSLMHGLRPARPQAAAVIEMKLENPLGFRSESRRDQRQFSKSLVVSGIGLLCPLAG